MVDSMTNDEVLLRFDSPEGDLSLVLEDDAKVAYAYLLERDVIVSDVWLYNVAQAPESVDWKDSSQLPFLNPKQFCKSASMPRLTKESKISCSWSEKGVQVRVEGLLVAQLERGVKPGWSRWAALPGPLAKPLE